MESYTYMSDEGVAAVITANAKRASNPHAHQYGLTLNQSDFRFMIEALVYTFHNSIDGELIQWAGDTVSSIAETLGIEFV